MSSPTPAVEMSTVGSTLIARLQGRLDAHQSAIVQAELGAAFGRDAQNLVLNLAGVSYLSSASLRIFLQFHREAARQGGQFALAGLQPYCREVLRISGLADALTIFETGAEAMAAFEPGKEIHDLPCGRFQIHGGSTEPGGIEVLGHIDDVLESRVTASMLKSKTFSSKGYSLGLGGMGPTDEEVLPLIGEMMTIGGTMVWLPTDGNDTPDFMIPHGDSEVVKIRSAFNASLAGPFNEFIHFTAQGEQGADMTAIYRALFELAAQRRPDFKGAIGLAMRADMSAVHGSGVIRAPIASQAPANGLRITDPENFDEWFEIDHEPRHRHVTGLISGVGLDLTRDDSGYDPKMLAATFYRNPGNQPANGCLLHNHGVFFSALPFPNPPRELSAEIDAVVEEGDFVDMRHLLDRTSITRALIGVIYVQDFRADPET